MADTIAVRRASENSTNEAAKEAKEGLVGTDNVPLQYKTMHWG